VVRSS